jgi:hypothetical protein
MLVHKGFGNDSSGEDFRKLTKFIGLTNKEVFEFLDDTVKSLYLEAFANPAESEYYYRQGDELIPRFEISEVEAYPIKFPTVQL